MAIDFLLAAFAEHRAADAIVWRDRAYAYGWLAEEVRTWRERLAGAAGAGTVTAVAADFSPTAVAAFLALAEAAAVVVPLAGAAGLGRDRLLDVAQAEVVLRIGTDDGFALEPTGRRAAHALYDELRRRGHPGLLLFSSGSTGEPKAALHDLVPLLDKFRVRRPALRTISFLLYDHIGGVNTMLHTLANGGCLVTVDDRSPDAVLAAVARHRVELLPTTPTFLNLVLLSEAWRRHDLSSLRVVTYGTEPMPESTLRRFQEVCPQARLQQTYGLSEVGILRSRSRDSGSLWVKLGGEGFETRVVDGTLRVRARSAMLGYLNAPSPFDADGWLDTGDWAEQDGDYYRIRGRRSEIINVGGQKVFPAEVESVVQEMPEVADVAVYGERHPITGMIVCARVTPAAGTDPGGLPAAVRRHCRERLEPYKVPVKVELAAGPQHGERVKRLRPRSGADAPET